jgi:hypothetical protein
MPVDIGENALTKIYTKIELEWNPKTKLYERVYEESYEHDGKIAQCGKDGGGSDYSPPQAPDPAATAAAQGAQDRKTAMTNAVLLNPNINSPYGSISYDTNSYNVGEDVTNVTRPTQTTVLNPAQQRQLDSRNQISDYLNTAGINLASRMPQTELIAPNTPIRPTSIDYSGVDQTPTLDQFEGDRSRVEKSVYDRQMRLMQPDLDQQKKSLEERLIQTGNPLGSESYGKEMDRYNRNYNESLQSLSDRAVLAGADEQNRLFNTANQLKTQQISDAMRPYQTADQLRKDQISENQLLRNQQINELSAILQGREAITLPVGGQYNQTALRAPDIAGMTQQAYQSNLANYNQAFQANQQAQNAQSQGMFGIGSSLLNLGTRAFFGL